MTARSLERALRWRFFQELPSRVEGVNPSDSRVECAGCHRFFRSYQIEIDHILARRLGGAPKARSNLQALCRSCHQKKEMDENKVVYELQHGGKRRKWLDWLARRWGRGTHV